MLIRLQKYLADNGVTSRRAAEELIQKGKVTVNGLTVTTLGKKIDSEADVVFCNGVRVNNETNYVYIILHKPVGYVSTVKDQFNRPTVMDLLKGVKERVVPVGRLDYDTSGLLLFTNDGALTFKLTHPKHSIEKVYLGIVCGEITKEQLNAFEGGLIIDGYKTAPAKIQLLKYEKERSYVKITLHEGKNRQVRKMCAAIGHEVVSLKRIATGKLSLGDLKRGEYRYLTKAEIEYLKRI